MPYSPSKTCLLLLHMTLLLLGVIFSTAGLAQEAVQEEPVGQIDAQRMQGLIDTLEDPAEREVFLDRLRVLVEVEQEAVEDEQSGGLASALVAAASRSIAQFSTRISNATDYIENAPSILGSISAALARPVTRDILLEAGAKILIVFTLALLVAFLLGRLLTRGRLALASRHARSLPSRILLLLSSLFLKLVPLAAFMAVAYLLLPLLDPRPITRIVIITLINAHVIAQTLTVFARTLLSVDNPALRPYPMEDATAAYFYVWIRRLGLLIIYGYFIAEALLLLGMDRSAHGFLVDVIGFFVTLLLISMVLQSRSAVANYIRGEQVSNPLMGQLRSTAAVLWHLLAMAYIIGVFVVWAFEVEGGFAYLLRSSLVTVVVVVIMRLCLIGVERGLLRLFHVPEHMRLQYPDVEERANRYRPAIAKVLKAIIVVIGLMAILEAWGVDATYFLATDLGKEIVARLARIAFVIALSFLLWEVISALIEKQLKAKMGSNKRIQTLLPLLKNLARLIIVVLAVMITLSEIGMDIGPLLASAGVIGLAIGFGAQTLVRDLMTGMFVILEDIISVGDWVEVGSHNGMVESMSIRTMRLRDLDGNLRIIPFGEVSSVHKVAHDYSFALMVIGVAYRENTDRVIDLLIQIGESMRGETEWGQKILEPLEVHGVNELASSSVDIRVRFKCEPLQQWGVRREFLRRTKLLFDEQGIEIPYPHQTVYFGEDGSGQAPPARVQLQGDGPAPSDSPS